MEKVCVQQTGIGLLKQDIYSENANQPDFITTAGIFLQKAFFFLTLSTDL